jgi:hypothetical protein
MNTIVAYQFRNSATLYSSDTSEFMWNKKCYVRFGPSVHRMWNVVAKWTIKTKQNRKRKALKPSSSRFSLKGDGLRRKE